MDDNEEDESESEESPEDGGDGTSKSRRSRILPRSEPEGETFVVERTDRVSKGARFRPNERGHSQQPPNGKGNPLRHWEEHTRNVNPSAVKKDVDRRFRNDRSDRAETRAPAKKDVINIKEDREGEPMAIDEKPVEDRKQDVSKDSGRHISDMLWEGGNVRAKNNRVTLDLIKEIMNQRLTIPLDTLIRLAPELRQTLGKAVKASPNLEAKETAHTEGREAAKESNSCSPVFTNLRSLS